MGTQHDLLYTIFERHLLTYSEENEQLESFATRVVKEYLVQMTRQGVSVPIKLRSALEKDLHEEVIEMARKKTYGHPSLQNYREQNLLAPGTGRRTS